jgi:hypothetical protein
VNLLAGGGVSEREVRDERGLELRDREYPRSGFELPIARILCPDPRSREGLADIALVGVCGTLIVAGEARDFGVELQDGVAALPGDVGAELPGGGEEEAGEELGEPQAVLAGAAEEGERAVEEEAVAFSCGFQAVDLAQELHVLEDEPGVGRRPELHTKIFGGVENALYLSDVVA